MTRQKLSLKDYLEPGFEDKIQAKDYGRRNETIKKDWKESSKSQDDKKGVNSHANNFSGPRDIPTEISNFGI